MGSPNEHARLAIEAYLETESPLHAVLVDAPWGAGKTHFIRDECLKKAALDSWRYVSLSGVSDEAAFRRALLKESLHGTIANNVKVVGNIVEALSKTKGLGDLARDAAESQLISKLPDTLVFDDLERANLPAKALLGWINDFVEHKGKRVILLANSEPDDFKHAFLAKKEKLIGKTLTIVPNFDAAFDHTLTMLPDGAARNYLSTHKTLVQEVFDQAGHKNLRILRNTLRDCAQILDRIEAPLFEAKEAMGRFVRTYLALAMAIAKGEISADDLPIRANQFRGMFGESPEDPSPFRAIADRHPGADVLQHSGITLPNSLATLLFLDGHAPDKELNAILRATGQFEPQEENPLWRRLIFWSDYGWDECEALVQDAIDYLLQRQDIEPGPYLHIVGALLGIEENGGLEISRQDLIDRVSDRIRALAQEGKVPAAVLGRRFGWGKDDVHYSFGGYAAALHSDLEQIMNVMQQAQEEAYFCRMQDITSGLLREYEADIVGFYLQFSHSNLAETYFSIPILHQLEADKFAEITLAHLKAGEAGKLGDVFKKLAERHRQSEQDWQAEINWAGQLKELLDEKIKQHPRLAQAQFDVFCTRCWEFPKLDDGVDD